MAEPLHPQPARQNDQPPTGTAPTGRVPDDAPDRVQVSPTGAIMGKPGAEHGMYGMVRENTAEADALTEREIRGVEPGKTAPLP